MQKKYILRRIRSQRGPDQKQTKGQKQKDKPLQPWQIINTVVQRSACKWWI